MEIWELWKRKMEREGNQKKRKGRRKKYPEIFKFNISFLELFSIGKNAGLLDN